MPGSHLRIRRASRTVGFALTGLSIALPFAGVAFAGTNPASAQIQCSTLDQATGITGFSNFSLFTPGNVTVSTPVDIQGAAAIGGTAMLDNYTVDSANATPLPLGYSLVAPTLANGSTVIITDGNYAYGGNPAHVYNNGSGTRIPSSAATDTNPLDFAQLSSDLSGFSAGLAAIAPNMTLSKIDPAHYSLTGTSTSGNAFDTTISQLAPSAGSTLDISAPAGSTVVINVTDSGTVNLAPLATINLVGVSQSTVIWNFPNASAITAGSTQWKGTILAPAASLDYPGAQVDGSVYVASLSGATEIHYFPFTGTLCTSTTTTQGPTTTSASTSSSTTSSSTTSTGVPTSVTAPSLGGTTTTAASTTSTSAAATTTTAASTTSTSAAATTTTAASTTSTGAGSGASSGGTTTTFGSNAAGASAPSSSVTVPATNTGKPWAANTYWIASAIAGLAGLALIAGRRPRGAQRN